MAYLIGSALVSVTNPSQLFLDAVIISSAVGAGGFLFSRAFMVMSNSVSGTSYNYVKQYLMISGYGIILLALAIDSPVIYAPYPPFGLVSYSLVPLSSYSFCIGFYLCALTLSLNSKLRQLIRESLTEQADFLESIGNAQMEKELQDRVKAICLEQYQRMKEETGFEPCLSQDEIKDYIITVLRETKTRNP